MGCLNPLTLEDLDELYAPRTSFDPARLFAESELQLTQSEIDGLRHVSGAWGDARLSGAKGGVLEQVVVDRLTANPQVVVLSAHPDNPNAHGLDVVGFDRSSQTVFKIEAKNYGSPDRTAFVGAGRLATLQTPVDATHMFDEIRVSEAQAHGPAILSALCHGRVESFAVTGPYSKLSGRADCEGVEFEKVVA